MRLARLLLVDAARAMALIAALSGASAAGAQEADTPLRVGVLPIADVAPLYLGISQGFFKQEHLAIEPVPALSGAVTLTAVASGDNQIGYGNVVSLILANAHGIPIEAIANGSQTFGDSKHQAGVLVVAGNSPIHTLADLEGKTIGVNQINGMNDLVIKSILSRRGVNVSKVKFIELPPTTAAGALKDGRVDAIMTTDPFLAQAESDGDRPILRPLDDFAPRLTLGVYYASRAFINANPTTITRFQHAMWRSLAYAREHPDEARRIIPLYTRMNAHDVATYDLVAWDAPINMASVEQLEHAMVTFGLLSQEVDLNDMFLPSAAKGR